MTNGFVLSATLDKKYYTSAMLLIDSILDYYKDANITLFTEERFVNSSDKKYVNIVTDCPVNKRTKLYSLYNTSYDLCCYLDADMECINSDIENVFDELGNYDIALTKIREYAASQYYFNHGYDNLTWHCGMFIFRKDINWFMKMWWDNYNLQISNPEKFIDKPDNIKRWDQYTFWHLNKKYKLKIKELDARWNFVHLYKKEETDKEIVLLHHTI